MKRFDWPHALISMVLFGAIGVIVLHFARAESVPGQVQSVSMTQVAGTHDMLATWTPPASGTVTGYLIQVYQVSGIFRGQVYCPGADCTSKTLRGLDPGGAYGAVVSAGNSAGYGPARGMSPLTLNSVCQAGVRLCATINTAGNNGSATYRASGYLFSYPYDMQNPVLQSLHPKTWRFSAWNIDPENYDRAKASGARTINVLSNMWDGTTRTNGGAKTPWSDWNQYREFVHSTVANFLATGRRPDYWEVQNEPGSSGYYNATDYPTWTAANMLEQFKVAYQEIRAIDPTAKVIGPSLDGFIVYPGQPGNNLDLETFLAYVESNGIALGAVTWHENQNHPVSVTTEFGIWPVHIVDRVAKVRAMLAAHHLSSTEVFIGEYGPPNVVDKPGWSVGYITALEAANINGANRACHLTTTISGAPASDCDLPSLDGLFRSDGTTPRPGFWVYQAYGQMSGTRLPVTTSDGHISVFSARDSSGVVRVLVGRHVVTPDETQVVWEGPRIAAPTPVKMQLRLDGITTNAINLTVKKLPSIAGTTVPAVVQSAQLPVVNGVATVVFDSIADYEAYSITAQPVTVTTPPPSSSPQSLGPQSPSSPSNANQASGATPNNSSGSTPFDPSSGNLQPVSPLPPSETKSIEVLVDNHRVAISNNGIVPTIDTSTLLNGKHTVTVRATGKDGQVKEATTEIYVQNKLNIYQKLRNMLFKRWGGRKASFLNRLFAIFVLAITIGYYGIGYGIWWFFKRFWHNKPPLGPTGTPPKMVNPNT